MTNTRCGFVALIGAPNAGKSTLTNMLVGAKVSIVTPKVQTTRSRLRGICMADENTQVVLIDTPGIFSPKHRLDKAMVTAAWDSLSEADIVCLMVDARKGLNTEMQNILTMLEEYKNGHILLVLNKVDTVRKEALLELTLQLNEAGLFRETFMISALKGSGVADLQAYLAKHMRESPFLYPPDQLSDINERIMSSEITREKLFLQLQQELPYALTVETDYWQEQKDGSVRIDQTVYVERNSQKGIVLGKQGQRLKAIGTAARHDIEHLLDRRVHLFLHVKVRENWKENPEAYRYLGLEFK